MFCPVWKQQGSMPMKILNETWKDEEQWRSYRRRAEMNKLKYGGLRGPNSTRGCPRSRPAWSLYWEAVAKRSCCCCCCWWRWLGYVQAGKLNVNPLRQKQTNRQTNRCRGKLRSSVMQKVSGWERLGRVSGQAKPGQARPVLCCVVWRLEEGCSCSDIAVMRKERKREARCQICRGSIFFKQAGLTM